MERIVLLLGRRDEPTDGVGDYCAWLGKALVAHGYELKVFRVCWAERGWRSALAELRGKSVAWRGCWVLLQYTNLAWSRYGFPFFVARTLSVLRDNGARCAVVFHDFSPWTGSRMIDRVRFRCQLEVLRHLYKRADRAIFTVTTEKVSWLSPDHRKAVFIPVGANCPEAPKKARAIVNDKKTIAVFGVTGGARARVEVSDISYAVKRVAGIVGPLRLWVMGRGSIEAEPALRAEFLGTNIELAAFGLLPAETISETLARADVQLFVRGQMSSQRGSAIAGIACGLPVVGYAGPETGWPMTEAGVLTVPIRDRKALAQALERVLTDDMLRASLGARSRQAQEQYFSWPMIATQIADALRSA